MRMVFGMGMIMIEDCFKRHLATLIQCSIVFSGRRGGDKMIMKKHVLVSVLVAFCLTFVLFGISPTRSASNPYDPWLDTNDDGVINMRDIGAECSAFGATGDPTKNVTIAGHASKLIILARAQLVESATYFTSDVISVDGYSKISVSITFTEPEFDYWLWTGHDPSNTLFLADQLDETTLGKLNCKTYDVMNTYIKIRVRNPGLYFGYLDLDVYLIP